MNTDLPIVPTTDLVKELCNRFDHGAICLIREDMTSPERREYTSLSQWIGNHHTSIGIIEQMKQRILDSLEDDASLLDDLGDNE